MAEIIYRANYVDELTGSLGSVIGPEEDLPKMAQQLAFGCYTFTHLEHTSGNHKFKQGYAGIDLAEKTAELRVLIADTPLSDLSLKTRRYLLQQLHGAPPDPNT